MNAPDVQQQPPRQNIAGAYFYDQPPTRHDDQHTNGDPSPQQPPSATSQLHQSPQQQHSQQPPFPPPPYADQQASAHPDAVPSTGEHDAGDDSGPTAVSFSLPSLAPLNSLCLTYRRPTQRPDSQCRRHPKTPHECFPPLRCQHFPFSLTFVNDGSAYIRHYRKSAAPKSQTPIPLCALERSPKSSVENGKAWQNTKSSTTRIALKSTRPTTL